MPIPSQLRRALAFGAATLLATSVGLTGSAAYAATTVNIYGHLVDGGTPVPNARVLVVSELNQYEGSGATDAAGDYSIPVPTPGRYKVEFILAGSVVQWHPQKAKVDQADWVSVSDSSVVVDEEVAAHGSLSGQLTWADGTAVPTFRVMVIPATIFDPVAQIDGYQGHYTLPFIPAGSYKLSFQADGYGGPVSYAHRKTTFADADVFEVAAGAQVTVDEQMPATGAITGHVSDHGQPVSGVFVNASDSVGQSFNATTAPDGSFRLTATPGSYVVSFQLPNGLSQYAYDRLPSQQPDQVVVTGGADTVVEEHVLPTGVITGSVLAANGTAATGVSVNATGVNLSNYAVTNSAGSYQMTVFAGTYVLSFRDRTQTVWAPHSSDAATANHYVVAADSVTTVNDTMFATGSITITARDARTQAPISSFCLYTAGVEEYPCTDNGTATLAAVGPGRHEVQVSSNGPDYLSSLVPVTVASGQNSAVVADLTRAGRFTTVVRDGSTGQPVENACAQLVDPQDLSSLGGPSRRCSGPDGRIEIDYATAGTFKVFVWANDGVHGDQWVGLTGGVGTVARAKPVVIRAGETTTMPAVKLDKAGSVSGTVTDASTGAPLSYGFVAIVPAGNGYDGNSVQSYVDAAGHYTLSGLGPYDWALFASGDSGRYAAAWSGDTGNRLLASTVKVTAGQTTTYNVAMRAGTTLTGTVTGPDGAPVPFTVVTVYNPLTGDEVATVDSRADGTYSAHVVGPQIVKVGYSGGAYGVQYAGIVGGEHPTLIVIAGSGTQTFNVSATTRTN